MIKKLPSTLSFAVLVLLVSACVPFWGYGPDGQEREEFERRVEAAFRLQNRMTSEIMAIQSDGTDYKEHQPIIQAEQAMEQHCSDLNEYASREMDGQSKGIFLLKRVENSVAECESAARKVQELLEAHQR